MKYLILLIITLVLLIPSLFYDWVIRNKQTHKDNTVSGDIYRFAHKQPIFVALVACVLTYFYVHTLVDFTLILTGVLLGHLLTRP